MRESNLRQIGIATFNYVADNKGYLPERFRDYLPISNGNYPINQTANGRPEYLPMLNATIRSSHQRQRPLTKRPDGQRLFGR